MAVPMKVFICQLLNNKSDLKYEKELVDPAECT